MQYYAIAVTFCSVFLSRPGVDGQAALERAFERRPGPANSSREKHSREKIFS
jgi:hypothetical protein